MLHLDVRFLNSHGQNQERNRNSSDIDGRFSPIRSLSHQQQESGVGYIVVVYETWTGVWKWWVCTISLHKHAPFPYTNTHLTAMHSSQTHFLFNNFLQSQSHHNMLNFANSQCSLFATPCKVVLFFAQTSKAQISKKKARVYKASCTWPIEVTNSSLFAWRLLKQIPLPGAPFSVLLLFFWHSQWISVVDAANLRLFLMTKVLCQLCALVHLLRNIDSNKYREPHECTHAPCMMTLLRSTPY